MALLIVPAKRKIEGPWLIGVEELESLDKILDLADHKLLASLENEIEETIRIENEKEYLPEDIIMLKIDQAKQRHSFDKKKKQIVITSVDDKKLSDRSIAGILKDPKINDFVPKEISIHLEHGINNALDFKISTASKGKLNYQLSCFDQETENEIRYELDRWVDNHHPQNILQLWLNHSEVLRFFLCGIALISVLMLFPTSSGSYQEEVKKRTYELLRKGVTKDNQAEAMELILSYESKYTPDKYVATTVENKELKLKVFTISMVLFLLLSIRPKTTIGLGKRKRLLNFYKFWWKFVVITIPVTFILNPIIEFIKSKI